MAHSFGLLGFSGKRCKYVKSLMCLASRGSFQEEACTIISARESTARLVKQTAEWHMNASSGCFSMQPAILLQRLTTPLADMHSVES